MKTGLQAWIAALIFLVLGLTSRFYRIDWSIQGDEPSSFEEVDSLLHKPFFLSCPEKLDRLPRAHPVGYLLQAGAYRAFGRTEQGARTGPALAGALSIAIIVLLTCRLYDNRTGIVLGALLLLWPWHLFHSQNSRAYGYAFLFGSVGMLSAALAWRRNSAGWGVLAGVASALGVSCHGTAVMIPAAMVAYAVVERLRGAALPRRAVVSFALVGSPLLLAACILAYLGMRGWGGEAAAGYSSVHTLMGLAFNLTWPVALLAMVGWTGAWRDQEATWRMWMVTASVAVAAACVAPRVVASFRQDYLYAASLAFFLLASRVVVKVLEALQGRSRALAAGVVCAILALSLPSVASYYQDGDRPDYRSAARYIRERRGAADIVAGSSAECLEYYLHTPVTVVPQPEAGREDKTLRELEDLLARGRRVWLVWHFSRNEAPGEVDRWLWRNGVRLVHEKKKRFDYHENVTDVYLLDGKSRWTE